MLRIRVIKAVAPRVRYHLHSPALTAEEKRGHWQGAGAPAAGLDAALPVAEQDFARALRGYAPDGRYLGRQRKANRRAGWDVVLSPHKSVSIAALCLPEKVSRYVRESWDLAVRSTILAMEALACRCDGPNDPVATGNLIVAAFTHERSRRNDPHLHTHCIVINATHDATHARSWRGLEPAPIFRNNALLDAALQRELHRQLTLRGIPCSLDAKGRVRLAVPDAIVTRLSAAKRAIDDALLDPPDNLAGIRDRDMLRNLLNDRLRPPKTPPLSALRHALNSRERRAVAHHLRPRRSRRLQPSTPPPPASLAREIEAHYHRQSLWPATKKLFSAVIEAARDSLAAPFESYLRALGRVRPPDPLPSAAANERQRPFTTLLVTANKAREARSALRLRAARRSGRAPPLPILAALLNRRRAAPPTAPPTAALQNAAHLPAGRSAAPPVRTI